MTGNGGRGVTRTPPCSRAATNAKAPPHGDPRRKTLMTSIPIKRALLSVSDKTGIVDLGKALAANGV